MSFNLKKEHFGERKGWSDVSPVRISLPSGVYTILANTASLFQEKTKCKFLDKAPTTLINVGFIQPSVCGDILVTMVEMGYNLNDKNEWKKALKEDKEKIIREYQNLIKKKPELFDEKAAKNKPQVDPKKIYKGKFKVKQNLIIEDYEKNGKPHKKLILPNFSIEREHLKMSMFVGKMNCSLFNIEATNDNTIISFGNGKILTLSLPVYLCGDAIITLNEMGYDFEGDISIIKEKVEKDRDKILATYEELIKQKPELFDGKKIDPKSVKEIEDQEKQYEKEEQMDESEPKFKLQKEHLTDFINDESTIRFLILPSGKIKVDCNNTHMVSSSFCAIFDREENTILINSGWSGTSLCGDALVTMNEMGYDFTDGKAIKDAKKEDKDKILQKFDQLLSSKPDLFSNEKADALLNKSLKASAAKKKKQQANELVELKKSYKEQHSKRIKWFAEDLGEGEKVVETVWGSEVTKSDGRKSSFLEGVLHEGIFVATNKKVIYGKRHITAGSRESEEILFSSIKGIKKKKSSGGSITLQLNVSGGDFYTIRLTPELEDRNKSVDLLVEHIDSMINGGATKSQVADDIPSQIKKLAELKDMGVLTEKEFDEKKTELLSKM